MRNESKTTELSQETVIGLALIEGFMIHSGHSGTDNKKPMPVSDAASLVRLANRIAEEVKCPTKL